MNDPDARSLDPARTTWHITFGTYGTRLHGGKKLTVALRANRPGEPFVDRNEFIERFERNLMTGDGVVLSDAQRAFVEKSMPAICQRGGWSLRTCASGAEGDHVHVLLAVDPSVHGKQVRKWLKRWLSEALTKEFGVPGVRWWAKGGSAKVIESESYMRNVLRYVEGQRTMRA